MPSEADAQHLQELLRQAKAASDALAAYLETIGGDKAEALSAARTVTRTQAGDADAARVVEGIFDGVHMLGMDGKQYTVPTNYASKSKLVEGDRMKLSISHDGTFLYKQIGPVERERKMGVLQKDETTGTYLVMADSRPYRVLQASVTYFNGEPGDETVILVPSGKACRWAAVENIIKK